MFELCSRQCHCVHKCNIIGLSSFCIGPLCQKSNLGSELDVLMVELGEQRVK